MRKGDKSVRLGIEDFLCPFTDMYITQGSMSNYTHKGIMANDVRGKYSGVKYPYYAPCTVKCLKIYRESGQIMWQSLNKVRFANGRVDYATFMTAHDDVITVSVGNVIAQGEELGHMGMKGLATGVHCHIEVSQSSNTSWTKNEYGIYHFENEYDLDYCYFVDNTNILYGMGGDWKKTTDIEILPEVKDEFVNLPPTVSSWRFYNIDVVPIKKNASGFLRPKKFGGLTYRIYEYRDYNTTVVIKTAQFGIVKIYIADTPATITNKPLYTHGDF